MNTLLKRLGSIVLAVATLSEIGIHGMNREKIQKRDCIKNDNATHLFRICFFIV